ncbi:hypothetical protein R5R35_001518 [Gryllus longicercus]|uniref:Toll-like receptor n=1 Tax=Gryllus longicercus TaxID=2509291 RepID=A0AAN9ZAD0_9ORTH
MWRRVTALLVFTVLQSVISTQHCQHTCKCNSISPTKESPLRADCREEPSGEWAKNIKTLKIRVKLQQLTTTTLQDAWKLTDADLRFCNITQIMSNALAKVTNLSNLWLSHNLIEKVDLEAFSKLENLKRLFLDNNRLTTFSTNMHLSLKYLADLFLQKNNLTDIPQLPPSLKYLDISNNKITTLNTQLMANLAYLDVCINPINNIKSHEILKKMKSLCLSGNINYIPGNFSSYFISLQNFTFISYPNKTTLNKKYDKRLTLHNVNIFHIGNTNFQDLLFLRNMNKMETLKLRGVNIEDFGSLDTVLPTFQQVKNLDFEDSPALVKTILNNFQGLQNLSNLETISLKNSNVVHLPCELCQMQNVFKIDFRNNPLDCDCRISEIEASLPNPLRDYIILPENTKCQSPQQVFGLQIYKYGRYINCSGTEICGRENFTCKIIPNLLITTSSSFIYEDDNSIYYIILGVVIAILGTTIICLIITSIILRKERRVEPQQEIQTQSFQQLQQTASEDTSLI